MDAGGQNIVNKNNQLIVKYDWYDPNRRVKGNEIGNSSSNTNAADIRYSTVSLGYNYYMNDNIKLCLWYDRVTNENTLLNDFNSDIKDDVFTCRLQFRF